MNFRGGWPHRLLIPGRKVVIPVKKHQPAAYHSVVWDGRDASGRPLPSGVYIARLLAGDFVAGIKMVLLK